METAGPTLEFTQGVPYDAYVHASTLHTLQQPLSEDPGEMSFLMISQVMELYFGLIRFELGHTRQCLHTDDVPGALGALRRTLGHLEGLNAAWRSLRWMTPPDFNRFRELLGEASGFQSAMYRQVEHLLGLKAASLVRPFRRDRHTHQELLATLAAPSVWDEATGLLHRSGYTVPASVRERDYSTEYQPSPEVEAAWVGVYSDSSPQDPLRLLGEAFTDVAEEFGLWRYRHLIAAQRTIGGKLGSGGSAGITWLQHSLSRTVFPELWSARTAM